MKQEQLQEKISELQSELRYTKQRLRDVEKSKNNFKNKIKTLSIEFKQKKTKI